MKRRTILSVAAIAWFYVLLQSFLPPQGFFTGDQGPKYLQTAAFARQGILAPDIRVLSRDVDTELEYQDPILHRRGSRLVSAFSWLQPILTVPWLRVLGLRGLYVIPALAVIAIFLLARSLGRAAGAGSGEASAWAAVATTPVLFFGGELWEHAPAAAAAMATALLLAPTPSNGGATTTFAAAGGCAVLAALFREEGGLALPACLAARALVTRDFRDTARATAASVTGAAAAFAASIPLNIVVYGSWLPLHLTSEIDKTSGYIATRIDAIGVMLLPSPGATPFLIVIAVMAAVLALTRRQPPAVRTWIVTASIIALLTSLVAVPVMRFAGGTPQPLRDFTMSSAAHTWVFALAVPYVVLVPRLTAVGRYVLIGVPILIAATIAVVPSAGGAQWSPRYLLCAAPLLAVMAPWPIWGSANLPAFLARHVKLSVVTILLLSAAVQLEGIVALARTKRLNASVVANTLSATTADEVVLSTTPWFPELNATILFSRRILFTPSPDRMRDAIRRARAIGLRHIAVVSEGEGPALESCVARGPGAALGRGLELRRYVCGDW